MNLVFPHKFFENSSKFYISLRLGKLTNSRDMLQVTEHPVIQGLIMNEKRGRGETM